MSPAADLPGDVARLGPGDVDALYTDMGDVLVKLRPDRFFRRLEALVPGIEPAFFYGEVLFRDVYLDFAAGRTDGPAFASGLARILGVAWTFQEFRDVWIDMFDPMPGAEEALVVARRAVPVYLLSNTDPVHMEHLRERHPFLDSVAGQHLSYEIGLLKPDPEYYLSALRRFGGDPSRIAFVDDRPENVEAARRVGLIAVHQSDDGLLPRLVDHLWGSGRPGTGLTPP